MEKDSNTEKALRQQQDQYVGQVLRRFAHYGMPTCMLIRKALVQKNGIYHLLQRLGIMPPASLEFQIQAVANFLKENGANNFLRLAGAPGKTRQEPPAAPAAPAPAPEIKAEAPTPAPQAAAPESAAPLLDEMGRYIGPERRSGVERRSGIDRRGEVETIRTNKRYGGDRRKMIRRQCDRVIACRLGLDARTYPAHPENKSA